VNAPRGSTALAGAFSDVMNQMASRLQAPQFAAPQMPAQPQMPRYLQGFMGGPSAAAAPAAPASAPSTSAPVTINIGGGGTPNAPTPAPTQAATMPGLNLSAMPGFGAGGQSTQLPGALQGYAPATVDSLHQLWGNELSSGAVTSPVTG